MDFYSEIEVTKINDCNNGSGPIDFRNKLYSFVLSVVLLITGLFIFLNQQTLILLLHLIDFSSFCVVN